MRYRQQDPIGEFSDDKTHQLTFLEWWLQQLLNKICRIEMWHIFHKSDTINNTHLTPICIIVLCFGCITISSKFRLTVACSRNGSRKHTEIPRRKKGRSIKVNVNPQPNYFRLTQWWFYARIMIMCYSNLKAV